MKRIFLASTFALVIGAANAADMAPVYRKAPLATADYWTGFYAGLNVGYGVGVGDYVSVLPLNIGTFGAQGDVGRAAAPGFLGGGQVGFNWRMAPQWVVGVEADFQGAGQSMCPRWRGVSPLARASTRSMRD